MKVNAAGIVVEHMDERAVINELRKNGPFRILTTYFDGCWDDIQYAARRAGYWACRGNDEKLIEMHLFSEYYGFFQLESDKKKK